MVVILLADGFEESEALVPADLLRRANREVSLAGLDSRQVTGGHGIAVTADCTLADLDPDGIELLMLPGGLGGVSAIQASPAALDLIRQVWEKGALLAAICAAPTLLAPLGILEGRRAVCYPGMEDGLGPARACKGERVVVDGRLITGEAAGSAFDFGLALIEALDGRAAADAVRQGVHYHG